MAGWKLDKTEPKPGAPAHPPDGTPVPARSERQLSMRRSQRVYLRCPVSVYGQGADSKIFVEDGFSAIVSAHGAMVPMATPVKPQQRLFLLNGRTQEAVECYVATVGKMEDGKAEVGIGFTEPHPNYWGMSFPPDDWDPRKRKLPGAAA
jgi:hypothetical protein